MPLTFTEADFQPSTNRVFTEADFAPSGPGPKKSRKAIEKEVAKAQTMRPPIEEQGMIGRAAGAVMPYAESLTPQGWMRAVGTVATEGMNLPARAYSALMPNQTPPFVINRDTQTLSQGAPIPFNPTPFQQGVPTVRLPQSRALQLGEVQEEPLTQVVRETIEGFTTPEGLVTLPATAAPGLPGRAAAGLFLGQTVPEAGRQAIEALTTDDPRERELATMRAVLNTIFSGLLGKQVRGPEVPRSGLTSKDFHSELTPQDYFLMGQKPAPPSLQIPEMTSVGNLGTRMAFDPGPTGAGKEIRPGYPTPVNQGRLLPEHATAAGPARFAVDPLGQALDVTQLSPRELAEAMRGPKEFVPRETYVSPAQQPPAILPAPIQLRRLAPPPAPEPTIIQPSVPTRPPVEPSGGEISFRAPAAAQAIPNALQQAQPPPPYAPTIPSPQAEVPPVRNVRGTGGTPRSSGPQQLGEEVGGQGLRGPGAGQEAPQAQGLEVVKQGTSRFKNPQGDPIGTTYRATPEDWSAWQELVKKPLDEPGVWPAREAIKNKYGGMPPEPPAAPSTPRLYAGEGLLFDPKFYKDTAKQVKVYGKKLKEYFRGASDKVVQDIMDFQPGQLLPDYQEKGKANRLFTQPVGTERLPVLSRLFGAKGRIRTPQDESLATWHAERYGVAPAIASSFGEQIKGSINSVFKVDENGNLNVKGRAGASLKPADVFEAIKADPLAYELSIPQRKVFNQVIRPVTERMTQLAVKYDLIDATPDEAGGFESYFPRIVVEHPKKEGGVGAIGGFGTLSNPVGKKRAFSAEAEGVQKGYKYEPDLEKRLVTKIKSLYEAAANKRLAEDPVLGAISEGQKMSQLKEFYAEELASGEMTQKKLNRMMEGIRATGGVNQPMLVGKIFDKETAKLLNREFSAEQSRLRKTIVSVNSAIKGIQLGFDLGVGQLQMLPFLYDHPTLWAKAQVKSLQAMVDPRAFSKYVKDNAQVVSEIAQLGSSVGRLQEHMSGLGAGQPIVDFPKKAGAAFQKLTGIPGSRYVIGAPGYVAEAFGRQFQTAMDVAKIETYKAWKEAGIPPGEAVKVMQTIENTLLSARTQSVGVSHRRVLIEQMAFLAHAYYRGGVELVAGMLDKGVSGKIARRSVARFALGMTATFYAISKYLQSQGLMTDEEIEQRFDPRRSDFLTWPVEHKDGSRSNLGFGGLYRNWLRLMGNVVKTSQEHPEDWKSLSPEKNPLTRWYRAHASPLPSLGWEAFTGKDFLGRESDVLDLGKRVLPLAAQQGLNRPEELPTKPIELATSFLGGQATPEPFTERRNREIKEASNRLYLKDYGELTFKQRAHVDGEVDKKLEGVKTGLTEAQARNIAIKKADERFKALQEGLDPEVKAWLGEKGLKVRNYQLFKTLGGQQIRLAPDEQEVFEQAIKEEYEKQLRFVMGRQRQTQDYLDKRLEMARSDAWKEVRRYIASKRTGVQTPAMPQ